MSDELKLIDFSQGIRETEIQHNFNALQDQLKRERACVGGPGVSYGFGFSLDDFTLTIDNGCLIAKDGTEVFIDTKVIQVELPILIEHSQLLLEPDAYKRIYLDYDAYALTRRTTSDNVDLKDAGVTVYKAGTDTSLLIANIDDNIITLNEPCETVDVYYNYTFKRLDAIYIGKDYQIHYLQGITSYSPSIPDIPDDECLYMLGYLEVDGMYINDDNIVEAHVEFVKTFNCLRNLYTDSDNQLYICGEPWESIKKVYFKEPTNPTENTLWYDAFSNELKVWRYTDYYDFSDTIIFTSSDTEHNKNFDTVVPYIYLGKQLSVALNGEQLTLYEDYVEGSDLTDLEKEDKEDVYTWSKQFHINRKLKKGDVISYRIKRTDGYAEWVAVNNKGFTPCQERFIFTPEYINHLIVDCKMDLQHFFFNATEQRNLLFTPGKNCIEVLVNQVPLHNDQFEEVTVHDAVVGKNASFIRQQLTNYYGFNNKFDIYELNADYENLGVGIKLGAPLSTKNLEDLHLEVRVTHRVNSNPIAKRFQRSATFINEENITYSKFIQTEEGNIYQEPIFTCSHPYRYQENQLEVYLDGIKLKKDIDFIEVAEDTTLKGTALYKFKILKNLKDGAVITYKISSTVYSYDHVEELLKEYVKDIADSKAIAEDCQKSVDTMKKQVNDFSETIEKQLENIYNLESTFDSKYMPKDKQIDKDNLKPELYQGIANNVINKIYSITSMYQEIDVTNYISINDFIVIYNLNSNIILVRDRDYVLIEDEDYTKLIIKSPTIESGQSLYVFGISFNN